MFFRLDYWTIKRIVIRSLPKTYWGTTIEDIFLNLISKTEIPNESEILLLEDAFHHLILKGKSNIVDFLPTGRPVPPFRQAFTIFYKAHLESWKRSWLTLLLTVIIGTAGANIPLVFISRELEIVLREILQCYIFPLFIFLFVISLPRGFLSSVGHFTPNITAILGKHHWVLANYKCVPDNANFRSISFLKNFFLGRVALFFVLHFFNSDISRSLPGTSFS